MKLGVMGGTFDPVHEGHLAAARAAIDCARLDRVCLIPTGEPPHRSPTVAGAADRLEMCRLAVEGERRLYVSDIEVRRAGRSFTVDTLRELKRLDPAADLRLILGWDAAQLFGTWHRPEEILRLVRVVVVTRPETGALTASALESAGLGAGTTDVCARPTPDISASAIRDAIARGESVDGLVPPAVAEYIDRHGLYRDNQDIG